MTINSKNTKAEILAAYKEIAQQKKVLESQVKQVRHYPVTNSTKDTAQAKPANKTPLNSKNITHTIQSLAQIQENFGGAVGNLSEHLIAEATQLAAVKQAIAREKLELDHLHQLREIDESTIDRLLDKYQALAKKFSDEFEQQQQQSESEIEALKQAWAKEQEIYRKSILARNEEYRKQQQREKEQYQYNLDLARDLSESEYEQEKKLRQQQLTETRQSLEQQWQQKEAEIARQEQEQAAAADKVAAFEAQLRSKIKQGTEEGQGIGTYQAKIKADLTHKEIEGLEQNYQLRIESLEQTISHQAARIGKLSQQLDRSLQQVQDLAVKAIEGTSNRHSLEAIKAIAMEQAKTPQKGK